MLLDHFPYEIVEEIFLYLPPSDRISTVKVNRWLNSIGRSKRLAVRHTLDGTIASMWLTLKTNTFFIERTNVEDDHPPRDVHTVKLHYSRYAPTMQSPEDEENYDIKNITIFFETRCCPMHYEADTGLDSELWKFPAKFITKYFYTSNHNDVYHFKFPTLEFMSESINIYLHYFSNIFSSIDFFELVIHDSMMIWERLGLFFEDYETLLKKPVIYFYNVAFNFSKFYWSKLFERGIESVGYQNVKEIFEFHDDYDKTSKFYEALSYNIMDETIAQLNDERLLLFRNYHKLEINCSSEITTNGLAKLVQVFKKNGVKI
ncbi:hypothetical protein WR25_14414 isoform B [Diploscapter pachys]|uniref:F-box domain-containing protein n=1 Tax=Diploscapter pachys TaxID=2018661 RepID=A0A2A2JGA2_9BILA|nr:hypothetical protein WR25_14414 isoform B [Diploscapter pachys]